MIETPIQLDAAQERQLFEDLRLIPQKIPVALRSAINRTGAKVKTITIKAVQETLPMSRADIDENRSKHRHGGVKLTKAAPSQQYGQISARVTISGRRISLSRFSPRPGSQQSTAGSKYRILERGAPGEHNWDQRRKRIKGPRSQSWLVDKSKGRRKSGTAFIVKFASGHLAIVERAPFIQRTKRGRLEHPLIERFGPSIPHVVQNNPDFARKLDIDVPAMLTHELAGQVDRFLKRPKSPELPGAEVGDA